MTTPANSRLLTLGNSYKYLNVVPNFAMSREREREREKEGERTLCHWTENQKQSKCLNVHLYFDCFWYLQDYGNIWCIFKYRQCRSLYYMWDNKMIFVSEFCFCLRSVQRVADSWLFQAWMSAAVEFTFRLEFIFFPGTPAVIRKFQISWKWKIC